MRDLPVPLLTERPPILIQTDAILEVLAEGVAVLHPDGAIAWANATLEKWCGGNLQGRHFFEVLGCPQVLAPDPLPSSPSSAAKPLNTRLYRRDSNQYLDLR